MKRILKFTVLFFLACAGFLIATLPVNYLLPYLPKSMPLAINGAQGTVWKGSATQLSWQGQSLGKVEWKIHPTSLLLLRLNADFKLSGEAIHADGNAVIKKDKSVLLTNTFLDAEIAKLPLSSLNMMVVPEGKISATIRSLSIQEQKLESADADVLWENAKITSPVELKLGQVSLNITGKEGALDGILDSKDGAIKATGKLNVSPQGLLKANIKLTPDTDAPADIKDLLPMIGKPDRNGTVTIKQKIQIPNWPS